MELGAGRDDVQPVHAHHTGGGGPAAGQPARALSLHLVGSSWINQIETRAGIITRQSIRRGTFTSVTVLIKQIRDNIDHWNTDPKPFQWTATADEILAKAKPVETNIKNSSTTTRSKDDGITRH
jgi:hypothetical protein